MDVDIINDDDTPDENSRLVCSASPPDPKYGLECYEDECSYCGVKVYVSTTSPKVKTKICENCLFINHSKEDSFALSAEAVKQIEKEFGPGAVEYAISKLKSMIRFMNGEEEDNG